MGFRKLFRTWNPGNVLVVVGVVALGFSFWMPYATAGRVSRIEDRAERLTGDLCRAAATMPDLDFTDPGAGQRLLDRVGSSHLELVETPARLAEQALVYRSKHYLHMVTQPPRDDSEEELDRDLPRTVPDPALAWRWPWRFTLEARPLVPSFEAYSWPASGINPGQTVFFHPSDDEPSFYRNMGMRYRGPDRPPAPGAGRKRILFRHKPGRLRWYRGNDNERWLIPRTDVEQPQSD